MSDNWPHTKHVYCTNGKISIWKKKTATHKFKEICYVQKWLRFSDFNFSNFPIVPQTNKNHCSAVWSFMCLIGLKYLWSEWSAAEEPPMGYGTGNVKATIFFLFLLIGTWVIVRFLHMFFLLLFVKNHSLINDFILHMFNFEITSTTNCRVVAPGLHTNASSKVLMLHLHQRMNQIRLQINILHIQLAMKPINTMSHHSRMLANSSKEVRITMTIHLTSISFMFRCSTTSTTKWIL